jgi:hypothetical protein
MEKHNVEPLLLQQVAYELLHPLYCPPCVQEFLQSPTQNRYECEHLGPLEFRSGASAEDCNPLGILLQGQNGLWWNSFMFGKAQESDGVALADQP